MQKRCNSIANALELYFFCIKPLISTQVLYMRDARVWDMHPSLIRPQWAKWNSECDTVVNLIQILTTDMP